MANGAGQAGIIAASAGVSAITDLLRDRTAERTTQQILQQMLRLSEQAERERLGVFDRATSAQIRRGAQPFLQQVRAGLGTRAGSPAGQQILAGAAQAPFLQRQQQAGQQLPGLLAQTGSLALSAQQFETSPELAGQLQQLAAGITRLRGMQQDGEQMQLDPSIRDLLLLLQQRQGTSLGEQPAAAAAIGALGAQ